MWGHCCGLCAPVLGLSPLLSPCGRRPLPQYLLICYKSCWDGAFHITEEVTPPPMCPHTTGAAESSDPWDTSEPGDVVCWVAPWHQWGCRSPTHGMVGFRSRGRCQGPSGLSCPWMGQSPLSVAAFSSAWRCG